MPFCTNCGKEIVSGTQFCPYCGSSTVTPAEQSSTPVQTYTQPPPPPATQPEMQYQPPQPPAAQAFQAAREKAQSRPFTGILGIASMAVVLVCSFLPWVSWFGYTKSGWAGDGKITFFTGIIAILFFIVGITAKAKWPYIVSLVVSLLTAAVFVIDVVDVMDTAGLSSVSYGLYLGTAGACLAVIFSILGLAVTKK